MTTDHQDTRPRGRPPVGPDVNYRLPAEIRQGLADAKRPGESEAAAVRRLLTVALSSVLPGALRVAADCWDQMARDVRPDEADADALNRISATARTLIDLLDRGPADPARRRPRTTGGTT